MADLRLEPFGEQHLDAVDALVRDPVALRFTPLPDPVPEDQAASMLAAYDADDTRLAYAAVDGDGRFAALGVVVRIDRTAQECELGYLVPAERRGQGVATEVLRLLSELAFGELAMLRVQLRINADNAASEKVAARNGYTREGVLRSTHLKPGVRVDTAVWSRLASDS